MKKLLLTVFFGMNLVGCAGEADHQALLTQQGYSNVVIEGFAWLPCGQRRFNPYLKQVYSHGPERR